VPAAPKPVAPPLWLSGQLPASQKNSNSRDNGYGGITAEAVVEEAAAAEAAGVAAAAAAESTRTDVRCE
jgi:hypothetical protein